jgi:tetratricopeptide (TPR) repeat protein
LAHGTKGNLLRAQRRPADAIPEYETAIALDRNSATSFAQLGMCKLQTGSLAEVVPLAEQAIRLSPRDSIIHFWYLVIGLTHLLESRTDDAIAWYEKARSHNPAHPGVRLALAAAYGLRGETERAATVSAPRVQRAGGGRTVVSVK